MTKGKLLGCMVVNIVITSAMMFLMILPVAPWGLNILIPEGYEPQPWVEVLAMFGWIFYYGMTVCIGGKAFMRTGKASSMLIGSKKMENFFSSWLKSFPLAPKHSV